MNQNAVSKSWSLPGARPFPSGGKSPWSSVTMDLPKPLPAPAGKTLRGPKNLSLKSTCNSSASGLRNAKWDTLVSRKKEDDLAAANIGRYVIEHCGLADLKFSSSTPALSELQKPGASSSPSTKECHFLDENPSLASSVPRGQENQLSKETLMSLGIAEAKRKPKSCMKREGSVPRAATLNNLTEVEVCLPSGKTIKRNNSVSFRGRVRVRKIPSSSSLADDPKELWYQGDEIEKIKRKTMTLIAVAKNPDIRKKLNYRGLEQYMPESRAKMKCRKNEAWDVVLETQDYQRGSGYFDEDQIAMIVRTLSQQSLVEAQQRAAIDAAYVAAGL